jgi:predicted RND superfamily exporter protein/outer membrane lipoprotein-sorting protein
MRNFPLVEFSVDHPRLIVALAITVTLLFMTQFPKMRTDTNPKNMLPATSDVRVWNDNVEKTFGLYEDMIVVGIVNEKGVLNPATLGKVQRISDEILKIKGVAARDVSSFTTIDNVSVENGILKVAPLMTAAPQDVKGVEALRKMLYENPLFINRLISKDGKTTAIYVPLEKGANGKEIADKIREIVKKEKGDERYYIAGDPVARDTFGAEMFKLMAVFAPIAGMVMLIVRYLMFRDLFLSITLMMDAMISIVWSMGLLIGLGFPIHIMSSMAPVFLMAIATDSMHIFNEFYFRYRETKNKKRAIIETMQAVSRPVRNTALATAAGFGVLLFMNIIPVKVFGGLVAFGTIVLRVLSFSFIPAMFTFVSDEKIAKIASREDVEHGRTARFLKKLAGLGADHAKSVTAVGLFLVVIAIAGIAHTVVNNNLVEWFKKDSDVRTADRVMNSALGGTSLGYVVAIAPHDDYIKTPEAMRYIEGLQRHLEKLPVVGKTTSVVDYVKRINRVLHDDNPRYDAVPDSKETIGQYLFLFSMSAKPSDLDNVVDYPFRRANIWAQLKTWDARAMQDVISAVEDYKKTNPTPMDMKPAGIAYFNLVWNHEVLWDMVKGFIMALIVVFCILALDFRSFKWAIVGYTPLLFTILLIYGVVGYTGKDFDMPISVLSCLSLGMAVDFAIHFVSRLRQRLADAPGESLHDACCWTAARPGKGIVRNAVLFAASFAVMIFAPLTPYITVGAFIVSMMLLSALMTILYMPALITLLRGWLFQGGADMKRVAAVTSIVLAFAMFSSIAAAADSGTEIVKKSQAAFLYAGNDFKARVMMKLISKGGQERIREMTMLRKNYGDTGGEQKYFMYFYQPADVKDMTFMVWKHPGKDADRWLFIPAINMVRRIAARDKSSSFVGSDFSYEDVSGRNLDDDTHVLVKEEKLDNKDCYVVKSTPKAADVDYSYELSWIDKTDYLPLKEEYYDLRGELYKVFTANEIKTVKGFPTITKRTMKNVQSGHTTEVTFTKTDYNIGIDDSLFSERFLKQPPKRWIE